MLFLLRPAFLPPFFFARASPPPGTIHPVMRVPLIINSNLCRTLFFGPLSFHRRCLHRIRTHLRMYTYIYKFILRTEFNHFYERNLSKEFYNLSTNLALVCNLEKKEKKEKSCRRTCSSSRRATTIKTNVCLP